MQIQIKGDENTFTFKHELRKFGAEWDSIKKIWLIDKEKFLDMTRLREPTRARRINVLGFELLNDTYENLITYAEASKLQNEINETQVIENKKIIEIEDTKKQVSNWLLNNSREKVISAIEDTLYCSKKAINVIEGRKSLSESQINQVEIYLS